jgi:AcrR family transcriptional regulator
MRKTCAVGSATLQGFVHEALVYSSDEELLSRVVPFVGRALQEGEPALVVLPAEKNARVQAALGAAAGDVAFTDAAVFYGRPATTIAAYRRILDEHLSSRSAGERLHVVAEVQFGDTVGEQAAWTRYEAMVNHCFAGSPAWIICSYDTRELPEHVVSYAACTHPFISTGAEHEASTAYRETDELVARAALAAGPAGRRDPLDRVQVRDEADIDRASRAVGRAARAAGLEAQTVADIVVVVSELLHDALQLGDAEVIVMRDGAAWVCDVVVPAPASHVGLSMARLVGEATELIADVDQETVRLTFAGASEVRQRILDAATELFYQRGIRATGTNAIIAHSGVAKASFFRHFPTKDDLVLAWLEQPASRWFDAIRQAIEPLPPRERLLAFFEALERWLGEETFRGCPFQNAVAETPDHDHPVRMAALEYGREIEDYLCATAAEAGIDEPARVARQLKVLADGAISSALATQSAAPGTAARDAAARLVG